MATKWSTPGVVFREVDNTIRANAEPGNGRGAIVLNANKGYPNQRVLSTSLDDFYKMYGEPDNVNQYGHFAAANFFGAGSQQLLSVRATMGDEGYAQVQYPYTDAATVDTNTVGEVQHFQFVDNEMTDQVKLINVPNSESWETLRNLGYESIPEKNNKVDYSSAISTFALSASAERAILKNVYSEFNGDDSQNIYVYRSEAAAHTDSAVSGKYYRFVTNSGKNSKYVEFTLKDQYSAANVKKLKQNESIETDEAYFTCKEPATSAESYIETDLYIPAVYTVDGNGGWVTGMQYLSACVASSEGEGADKKTTINDNVSFSVFLSATNLAVVNDKKNYEDAVKSATSAKNEALLPVLGNMDSEKPEMGVDVSYLRVCDWDDMETKNFLVRTSTVDSFGYTLTNSYSATNSAVVGLEYKEYGMADYTNELVLSGTNNIVVSACSAYNKTDDSDKYSELVAIAEEYGLNVADIVTKDYAILTYKPAKTWLNDNDTVTKIIKLDDDGHQIDTKGEYEGISKGLFAAYQEQGETKITQKSIYKYTPSESIVKPWQITDNKGNVSKMTAISTIEVMADSTGKYADGYTPSCETDEEPGNGDIEEFESNQQNQLVIAALGPGEWGNNIGVSIITAEAAKYPCLYNANAFSWKYRYDDEDKVDSAASPNDYEKNDENLTWKKVYRINVYVKSNDKTAKVWGFGLDALTSEPVESWYVSNDPTAKDAEGNTLYAPYVINGHSNYIYVSKKSVAAATNYKGTISQPKMTWSIYQLLGGTNSKLNNIKEKTAALKLYEDRSKADFDILFNVESIDTFNGRQRYSAHQRRIAEIAASRGMDIGVVQVTSREAKTIKMELSEAKAFSFNNGSYVAAYAGYDRYYDSYTANWVYLPKSVAGACAMCYCDVYSYPWMAPAGLARGQISYSNRSNIKLNDKEIGQLYDNNVNTSKNCISYGEVLWGQKTMLKKESALNRINVRRLLNYIEKNLETMLVPYLYQQNTVNTRTSMKTTIDAFLSRIQSAEGILSKNVTISTDPDDSHIVYATLNIVPAESIEWICVTLVLDRNTGVVASES